MSSRDVILNRIKEVKPVSNTLPEIPEFKMEEDITAAFIKSLEANHVQVIKSSPKEIDGHLRKITSGRKSKSALKDKAKVSNKADLADLEVFIAQGVIGAAENGAIWVFESLLGERVLPFITLHLVLVVKETDLVYNMHQAYNRIDPNEGFGVFIAGPSKTADIEQSLVIGAHGPKEMTVILEK